MSNPFVRREPPWLAVAGCAGLTLLVAIILVASDAGTTSTAYSVGGPASIFSHIVCSAGWVFGPIFVLLSAWMAGEIACLSWHLRREGTKPTALVNALKKAVAEGDVAADLRLLVTHDDSLLSRVVAAGLSRMEGEQIDSLDDAREAAIGEACYFRAQMEARIGSLTTIGTLGPLLGVMGTVFGLIITIRNFSGMP